MESTRPADPKGKLRPANSLLFAEKAARSISEIQGGVNNIGDVYVFLEVLGYDDKIASENGFLSLLELSEYIFNFIEYYDENKYGIVNTTNQPVGKTKETVQTAKQDLPSSTEHPQASPAISYLQSKSEMRDGSIPTFKGKVALIAEKGRTRMEQEAGRLSQKHSSRKSSLQKNKRDSKELPSKDPALMPIPTLKQRVLESLSIHSPWLTALFMLNITGFSLWMAQRLPADITIAFVSGVFLGLIATEGPLQMFSRLLFSSFEQKNVGEFKRNLARAYVIVTAVLAGVVGIVILIAQSLSIPNELTTIAIAAVATVSIHRISYMVVYALRKFKTLAISYGIAFIVLVSVYYLLPAETIPTDITSRYFVSLWAAFGILTIFAIYHHYRVFKEASLPETHKGSVPSFYSPPAVIHNTIKSRFGVQFWESIPYFTFGMFYFVMIFGDRILSWIFNPRILIAANGALMPMVFNSEYHAGADVALLVLVPTAIVQHVILSPVFAQISHKMATLKIPDIDVLNSFIKQKYRELLVASIVATLIPSIVLNIFGDEVMVLVHGSETSLMIMRFASAGNVLLAIFSANSLFMMFLNRAKVPSVMAIGGILIIAIAGGILGQELGDESIIYAYVAGAGVAAILSTIYAVRITKTSATRLLARYS
jgi:hypothetical protein